MASSLSRLNSGRRKRQKAMMNGTCFRCGKEKEQSRKQNTYCVACTKDNADRAKAKRDRKRNYGELFGEGKVKKKSELIIGVDLAYGKDKTFINGKEVKEE